MRFEMNALNSTNDAAGRLFRAYEAHCLNPGLDTLFQTLNAMHSLNDRLPPDTPKDFHSIEEFIALKAIRNFTHHQEDVRANVRVIPAPAISDLLIMCVVRRDQVEHAISNVKNKQHKEAARVACTNKFHWYGEAVNINPCLFNFVVHAYEMLVEIGVHASDDATARFTESYQYEVRCGHSHYVDGRFTSHISEVNTVLAEIVSAMPAP